eukprot:1193541-Prorocentrum_minimum.AAC.4
MPRCLIRGQGPPRTKHMVSRGMHFHNLSPRVTTGTHEQSIQRPSSPAPPPLAREPSARELSRCVDHPEHKWDG